MTVGALNKEKKFLRKKKAILVILNLLEKEYKYVRNKVIGFTFREPQRKKNYKK